MSLTYNCERKIYCLLGNKNKRRKLTNAKKWYYKKNKMLVNLALILNQCQIVKYNV